MTGAWAETTSSKLLFESASGWMSPSGLRLEAVTLLSPVRIRSSTPKHFFEYRPLAQLAEQQTLNLTVVGSTPTRPTISPSTPSKEKSHQKVTLEK